MKTFPRRAQGSAGLFLILLLCLAAAGFVSLKNTIDKIPRKKIPGASIIYIPSGKYLKYVTFGYSSLAADLVFVWAIQYYSTYTIVDRFAYLEHIFSIIAELDPRYQDPYEIGALIAFSEAKNPKLAYKIMDLALKMNPDQWIFPFEAGQYAQMARDYDTARKYYQEAIRIPGSPDIVKRLYAAVGFKLMDLRTAWDTWLEIYNTAADERTKKIASKHLYQVRSASDILILNGAIKRFQGQYGHNPESLAELVRPGYLESLPKDLDGKDYIYDSITGEVKAPTIWWKR